jgi:hypothetical protein
MMTTPSGFYAKGRNRSPAHDAMQAEFLSFLRQRIIAAPAGSHVIHRQVEVEMPIVQNGRVQAFADLAEIWDFQAGRVINLYEVKPAIESVGGLIRQCKAMLALAEASDLSGSIISCAAVVRWNDPLLPELRASYAHVWAWGIEFDLEAVAAE